MDLIYNWNKYQLRVQQWKLLLFETLQPFKWLSTRWRKTLLHHRFCAIHSIYFVYSMDSFEYFMKSSVYRCVLCVPRSMCFKEPSEFFTEHSKYVCKSKKQYVKVLLLFVFFSLFIIFSQFGKNSMLSGCNLTFHVNELTKNSVQFPLAGDYSLTFYWNPVKMLMNFFSWVFFFFVENVENLFFFILIQFPKMILHVISQKRS